MAPTSCRGTLSTKHSPRPENRELPGSSALLGVLWGAYFPAILGVPWDPSRSTDVPVSDTSILRHEAFSRSCSSTRRPSTSLARPGVPVPPSTDLFQTRTSSQAGERGSKSVGCVRLSAFWGGRFQPADATRLLHV